MTAIEVTGSSSNNKGIRREKYIDSIVWNCMFMCLYMILFKIMNQTHKYILNNN